MDTRTAKVAKEHLSRILAHGDQWEASTWGEQVQLASGDVAETERLAELFTESDCERLADACRAVYNSVENDIAEEAQKAGIPFAHGVPHEGREGEWEAFLQKGLEEWDTYLYLCRECGEEAIADPQYWQGHEHTCIAVAFGEETSGNDVWEAILHES